LLWDNGVKAQKLPKDKAEVLLAGVKAQKLPKDKAEVLHVGVKAQMSPKDKAEVLHAVAFQWRQREIDRHPKFWDAASSQWTGRNPNAGLDFWDEIASLSADDFRRGLASIEEILVHPKQNKDVDRLRSATLHLIPDLAARRSQVNVQKHTTEEVQMYELLMLTAAPQCKDVLEQARRVLDCLMYSIRSWVSLNSPRAKALFVPGLGRFDVVEAQETFRRKILVTQRERILDEMSGKSSFRGRWRRGHGRFLQRLRAAFPTVAELRAMGYSRKYGRELESLDPEMLRRILSLRADDVRFIFFMKHAAWFLRGDRNFRRLDEVLSLPRPGYPDFFDELPEMLESNNRNAGRVLDDVLHRRNLALKRGPRREFTWMQGFFQDEILTASGHRLVVLRNSDDVHDAGDVLRNCAGNYIKKIAGKDCLLVRLDGIATNKTIALGRLQNGRWVEISGTRNKSVPADVAKGFEDAREDLAKRFDRARSGPGSNNGVPQA